jgi:hypothetical protein
MGGTVEKRPAHLPVPVPGLPVRRRESEALIPAAFRGARRNSHLTLPLSVPPVMWTAGEILHALSLAPEAAAAGGVLSVAVYWAAPHKWTGKDGGPRWPEVWFARATAAGVSVIVTAEALLGATSGLPGEILGGLLLAFGAAWGIPYWRHKRPRGRGRRNRDLDGWQRWWAHHADHWALGGSRVTGLEEKGVTTRLRVQLWAGRQSVANVRAVTDRIESGLEGLAGIGMVRVEVDRQNPSQVDVFIKRDNPLRETVEWDRSRAPASVHDDAVQGLAEGGEWKRVPQRTSSFVNGATRSGKSNDLLLHAAQLAGCPDARIVVIDLKRRSAQVLIESAAADCVITDVAEARMFLAMAAAEIEARAVGAYDGEEQLLASPEIPALVIFCDEVNPLASQASGDAECARLLGLIASQGAGLEVYLRVYTQYGSLEESVRTEQTRANLPLRVCYRVEEARHGAFTIPEYARLDASALEEKGTHFVKLGKGAFPEQVRAPRMTHPEFLADTAATERVRASRPPWILFCAGGPSPAGGTWREWWASRWLRIDRRFRAVSPQYAEAARRYGEPGDAPAPAAAGPPETDAESPAEAAARIAAETSGPDPAPTAAMLAAASGGTEARKRAFCDALAAAPPRGISPAELMRASGMPRSTVMNYLARLRDRGAVAQPGEGAYAPVPGRDVHAELGAVRAGDDMLAAAGLRLVR